MTLTYFDKHSMNSDIVATQRFMWENEDGLISMESMDDDYLDNLIDYLERKIDQDLEDDYWDKGFYRGKLEAAKEVEKDRKIDDMVDI